MFGSIKRIFGKGKKRGIDYDYHESMGDGSQRKGLFDSKRWEKLNRDINSLSSKGSAGSESPMTQRPPAVEEIKIETKSEDVIVPKEPIIIEDDVKEKPSEPKKPQIAPEPKNLKLNVSKEPEMASEERKKIKLKFPIRIKKIRKPHEMDVGDDPDWFYLGEAYKKEKS